MNYLAHLYLSGDSEKLLVGNFIGDYVKGNRYLQYHNEIAKGIILHRHIDTFTDQHPRHLEAKRFFRNDFGHYAGILVDFTYDHFLASNWDEYSNVSLRWFAKHVHSVLLSHFTELPLRVQGFLPFLIQHKRLESYATIDGIIQSIQIMGKYSSLPSKSEIARKILLDNYNELNSNFKQFMNEAISFVKNEFTIDLNRHS
ncbi:MAG TPA: ACP phosphodiesterase [Draconibacterium sp.]|nr:ACP phosphodiesterase [Draconibacterium sp.]